MYLAEFFFPGCALMAHSPALVDNTYTYLKQHLQDIEMMSACCGKPTYILGGRNKYELNLNSIERQLRDQGITEIIVACQNCFMQFKRAYHDIKVTSLWEVMAEFGVNDNTQSRLANLNILFSLHDPCPARKENHIHDSIRILLKKSQLNYVEFEQNREKTLCCGAGNMLLALNPPAGLKQAHKRVDQSPTDFIITYCQSCVETFRMTGKTSVHLLELFFDNTLCTKEDLELKTKSTGQKWKNRLVVKRSINRMD